ncbi:MAG TPA: hypothetical protein VKZ52_08810 [Burkholderiaceae bacterium]|nr:hypothetical protein [Burkholderiaceae bacterium]
MASLARPPATSSELSAAYRAAAEREAQRTRTGAVIVGHPRPVAELGPDLIARLGAVQLAMYCDGRLKEQGTGSNVLGNPLNSVLHLMQGLAREGRPPLQAGSIVTTGTLTAAFPIAAGERWTTRLTGLDLPDLDVRFE